jgi:hypothetical protein
MFVGRPLEAVSNGSCRWMAAGPRERVHRTRPTGQLARRLNRKAVQCRFSLARRTASRAMLRTVGGRPGQRRLVVSYFLAQPFLDQASSWTPMSLGARSRAALCRCGRHGWAAVVAGQVRNRRAPCPEPEVSALFLGADQAQLKAQIRAKGRASRRTAGADWLGDEPWSFVCVLMLLIVTRADLCRSVDAGGRMASDHPANPQAATATARDRRSGQASADTAQNA